MPRQLTKGPLQLLLENVLEYELANKANFSQSKDIIFDVLTADQKKMGAAAAAADYIWVVESKLLPRLMNLLIEQASKSEEINNQVCEFLKVLFRSLYPVPRLSLVFDLSLSLKNDSQFEIKNLIDVIFVLAKLHQSRCMNKYSDFLNEVICFLEGDQFVEAQLKSQSIKCPLKNFAFTIQDCKEQLSVSLFHIVTYFISEFKESRIAANDKVDFFDSLSHLWSVVEKTKSLQPMLRKLVKYEFQWKLKLDELIAILLNCRIFISDVDKLKANKSKIELIICYGHCIANGISKKLVGYWHGQVHKVCVAPIPSSRSSVCVFSSHNSGDSAMSSSVSPSKLTNTNNY